MSSIIKNRSELLFLYDVKYANPNGDPMDMNRPRMDEDSMKCLVTDVRLKRTIRDYLDTQSKEITEEGNGIFIKEIIKDDGFVSSISNRLDEIKKLSKTEKKIDLENYLLENFIDTRLFGATYSMGKGRDGGKGDSIQFTGPVQFNIGSSLHKVKEVPFMLSPIMASGDKRKTGTLAEGGKKTIKYGLIGFHGLINEKAALHTKLTEKDVINLLKGMWWGTKELKTTSKNQQPILLLKIDYQPGFYIGDLMSYLEMENRFKTDGGQNDKIEDDQLESVTDYTINTNNLNMVLEKHKNKILSIGIKKDDRLKLSEPIFKAKELTIRQ